MFLLEQGFVCISCEIVILPTENLCTSAGKKIAWHAHKYSFNHIEAKQTTLSNYIHLLKEKNIQFEIHWDMMDSAKPFDPVTGTCALCNLEA